MAENPRGGAYYIAPPTTTQLPSGKASSSSSKGQQSVTIIDNTPRNEPTFALSDVDAAYSKWAALESRRLAARKAYDDAVIAGLNLTYNAQITFNAINSEATNARTDYYAIVAAYKKQLRKKLTP